jgi:sugar phosphate permease
MLERQNARAWFTWLLTSLFYSFQFFLRSAPNALSDQLMADFSIDATMLGLLSAAYYIPYSILQIPVGIALDVFGPKKILRIGTFVCVIGGLLFSFATTFPVAIAGRFFIGLGAAVSFIGSIRINSLWFSHARLAFAIGLLSAVGKLGGSAANALLPILVPKVPSWSHVIWVLCLCGFVLVGLIWLFVKNGPGDTFSPVIKTMSVKELKPQVFTVLKTPMVWMMGIYGYALYLTLSVFSDTYSINFLTERLHTSRSMAGSISSVVLMGSAVGASVLSYFSDKFRQRRPFLRFCSLITLLLSSLVFFGPPLPVWVMTVTLFALGFCSGGQVLVFVVAAESVPFQLTGIAVGVTNSILMMGGALHNPLIGFLMNWFWDGKQEKGHPIYSLLDYRIAFSSISICFAMAFVLSLIMKESHPERDLSAVER